jgi:predicted secreted acid phosphatase
MAEISTKEATRIVREVFEAHKRHKELKDDAHTFMCLSDQCHDFDAAWKKHWEDDKQNNRLTYGGG